MRKLTLPRLERRHIDHNDLIGYRITNEGIVRGLEMMTRAEKSPV